MVKSSVLFEQRLPFLTALFELRSLELRHTLYRRTIFGQAARNHLPATHPAERDHFSLRRRVSMICGTTPPLTHAGPVPRGPIGSIRAGSGLCNAARRRTRTRAGEPPPKDEGRREGERAGPSVPGASAAPSPHRVVMLVGPAMQNQQGHHAPQEPGQRHPVSPPPPPRKGAAASAVLATSSKSTPEQTPLTATDSTQKSQNSKAKREVGRFHAEGPFCGPSEVDERAFCVNSSIFVVPDPGARFSIRKPSVPGWPPAAEEA